MEVALMLTRRDEVLLPAVRAVERLGPRCRGLAGQACSALFSPSLTSSPNPDSETISGSFEVALNHYKRIKTVTAAEAQAAARKYLDPKTRTVITGVPK